MTELIKKNRLAMKLFEFAELQNIYAEQLDHELPFFKGQNKILIALHEEDDVSQKEIAQRLGISVQSTAEFIAKLLKKKYITKRKSENDGRVQLIRLTEKGRKEAEKSLLYIPDYLDYLNEEEKSQLGILLDKMNEGIIDNLELNGIKNIGTRIRMSMLEHQIK